MMKITCRKFLTIACFSFLGMLLHAEVRQLSQKEIQSFLFAQQNRPFFRSESPLEGFSEFIFLPMCPGSKAQAEKITSLIQKELEKAGEVKKFQLEVKNEKGEVGIDLSPFDVGANLIYEIQNLISLDGENTGFVRASLNLEARVNIIRTKEDCVPYLWSSNCFLKGNTEKDLEKLIVKSLAYLVEDFSESYQSVNAEKPTFNVYIP